MAPARSVSSMTWNRLTLPRPLANPFARAFQTRHFCTWDALVVSELKPVLAPVAWPRDIGWQNRLIIPICISDLFGRLYTGISQIGFHEH